MLPKEAVHDFDSKLFVLQDIIFLREFCENRFDLPLTSNDLFLDEIVALNTELLQLSFN